MSKSDTENGYFAYPNFTSGMNLYEMHGYTAGPGWSCPRHMHHMMVELNVVLEGRQTVVVNGRTFEQGAGELLIVPPMLLHEYRVEHTAGMRFFVIHLQMSDPSLPHMPELGEAGLYPKEAPLNRAVSPLLAELYAALREGGSRLRVLSLVYGLLARVEEHSARGTGQPCSSTDWTAAYRIAKEIEHCIRQPCDSFGSAEGTWLSRIAPALGMSKRHCRRVFHQAFGMAPREYVMILKQQEAMHMLIHDPGTVEQIAYKIGYQNVQSFSRQFRKWSGLPPHAFRAANRDNPFYLTSIQQMED
ncbi:MAG: hypothetical protein K0R57_3360 [Paenibacillaceae bacterium]|jgi:AraC-like DNA-binding protein/mannose-6-phosphate isomerase-like protein (cupin superfamily)|nr:hypothetical protein [Paenibacillaceae bacterium]